MLRKLLLTAPLFFVASVTAQITAEAALQTLDEKYPQEKIYLLTDKSSYTAGDRLWFKAFVMNGLTSSDISTSLMVELYNREKKLIVRRTVPIFEGEASGDFPVSDTLRENVYYMRAYTPWMTNFDEDFQYLKKLPVYNPGSKDKMVKETQSPWTISAHPEGGNLLNGVPVKIAVRMRTDGTFPDRWEGFLAEDSQPETPLVPFKALDRNIGILSFTPEAGKKYTIYVKDQNGKTAKTALPDVATEGLHLDVTSKDDKIEFHLKTHPQAPAVPYKVIASMGNQLVYKALFKHFSGEATYSIPTDQLINGVLQIAVFNANEQVVAKRLCFVMPGKLSVIQPDISATEISTQRRGKSTFDITAKNEIPLYTVRVTDASSKNFDEQENFLSAYWLTGDLPSPIDSPASYFSGKDSQAALDALLISEEWTRFDWNKILRSEFPKIVTKNNTYLSYTGKLTINGKPSPNTALNLMVNSESDKNVKIVQADTDSNGEFMLNNMVFNEPLTVRYQVNGLQSKLNEMALVYVKPAVAYIPFKKNFPVDTGYRFEARKAGDALPPQVVQSLNERNFQKAYDEKVTTIQEVHVTAKKKNATEELNKELSSPMFSSMDEKVFDFVNDNQGAGGYTNIMQWLQGRVAGLQVQNENGTPVPYIRNSRATIYLDEMQMDAASISSVSIPDIAMVKVVKGPLPGAIGGGGGGSVLIYTNRGNHKKNTDTSSLNSSLQSFTLGGYSKIQPFTIPDYSNAEIKNLGTDSRSVLYWNPHLEQDNQKPELLDFYNNDTAKKFNILILGFDREHLRPLFYQGPLN